MPAMPPAAGPPLCGAGLAQQLEDTLGHLVGLGLVGAKSASFCFPLTRKTALRSFAPPPPTEPASLGFGGDPAMLPLATQLLCRAQTAD